MANKFEGLVNLGKWSVANSESFTKEELDLIQSTKVVELQYGKAVQLVLKTGAVHNLMLSVNSQDVPVGSSVNLQNAKYLTLTKPGSGTIYRVEL